MNPASFLEPPGHAVSRLESQWYQVTFYTNQEWGRCN